MPLPVPPSTPVLDSTDGLLTSWLQSALGDDVWVSSTREGGNVDDDGSGLRLPLAVVSGSGSDADSPWVRDIDATVTVFADGRDAAFTLANRVDAAFVGIVDGVRVGYRSLTMLSRRQVFEEINDSNDAVVGLAAIYACSSQ